MELPSSYAACNERAQPGTLSMVDFYRSLAPLLPGRIVVYNGDTDPCVSYEGTRTAIEKVGFAVTQPYRPWFFNFTAAAPSVLQKKDLLFGPSLSLQSGGAQYGGEIVDYEHGLSFATVHGSGHMVPTVCAPPKIHHYPLGAHVCLDAAAFIFVSLRLSPSVVATVTTVCLPLGANSQFLPVRLSRYLST